MSVMTNTVSTLLVRKRLRRWAIETKAHVCPKLVFGLSQSCLVQIVRRQTKGMDVYMCEVGDQEMKLQLRALDESLAESSRLNKLVELAAIEPGEHLSFLASLIHLLAFSPTHLFT